MEHYWHETRILQWKAVARFYCLKPRIRLLTVSLDGCTAWTEQPTAHCVVGRLYCLNWATDCSLCRWTVVLPELSSRLLTVSLDGCAAWTEQPTAHCVVGRLCRLNWAADGSLCRWTVVPPDRAADCLLSVLVLKSLFVSHGKVLERIVARFSHIISYTWNLTHIQKPHKIHAHSTGKPALVVQTQDFVSPFLSRRL
jgi:hypothetical protein